VCSPQIKWRRLGRSLPAFSDGWIEVHERGSHNRPFPNSAMVQITHPSAYSITRTQLWKPTPLMQAEPHLDCRTTGPWSALSGVSMRALMRRLRVA